MDTLTMKFEKPEERSRVTSLRLVCDEAERNAQEAVGLILRQLQEAKNSGEEGLVDFINARLEDDAELSIHHGRLLTMRVDSVLNMGRSVAASLGDLPEDQKKVASDEALALLFYGLQHLLPLMWDVSPLMLAHRQMEGVVSLKSAVDTALRQFEDVLKQLGVDDTPALSLTATTKVVSSPDAANVNTPRPAMH